MKLTIQTGLLTLAACALTACATPSEAEREARLEERLAMADEAGLVCEYEQIMGSLRRQRVCRTQEDIDRSRAEAFRETDRIQRSTPGPVSG